MHGRSKQWYPLHALSEIKPIEETSPSFPFTELERFGAYRLVGPLAKGGMAELSLAVQTGLQGFSRVVALKRVLPNQAASPAFVDMFLDEARLAARLEHPNIVRIYELGQEQGRYFMAMEYLPGEDLLQVGNWAASARVDVECEVAATVVEKVAEALHFAHQLTDPNGRPLGLVHRDVTPSNVILTYNGHVKVVDFGIAKANSNTFETEAGMLKGKYGYLAPEQFEPGAALDRRVDIFGLGIVLWELLAGERLFQRETEAATLAAAHDAVVPPLHQVRPDVDEELELITLKALERDPAQRFQSAAELQEALEAYLRVKGTRPSERDLARWLEGLGGTRRAELKRSIAQGTNVMSNYAELRKLAPGTGPGVSRASNAPTGEEAAPRPLWQVALFALLGLLVLGGAAWLADSSSSFSLTKEQGMVAIVHAPAGGIVRVGEKTVQPDEVVALPVGKVHLEVRVGDQVVVSRELNVVPGPQTVDLSP